MKRRGLLFLVIVLVNLFIIFSIYGCSNNNVEKVNGTWEGSYDRIIRFNNGHYEDSTKYTRYGQGTYSIKNDKIIFKPLLGCTIQSYGVFIDEYWNLNEEDEFEIKYSIKNNVLTFYFEEEDDDDYEEQWILVNRNGAFNIAVNNEKNQYIKRNEILGNWYFNKSNVVSDLIAHELVFSIDGKLIIQNNNANGTGKLMETFTWNIDNNGMLNIESNEGLKQVYLILILTDSTLEYEGNIPGLGFVNVIYKR